MAYRSRPVPLVGDVRQRSGTRAAFNLCVIVAVLTGCGASVRTLDVSQAPSFTLASFNDMPADDLGKLMTTSPKAFVLLLKKGDRVPVKLRAAFGPIALEPGENYLVFSQDTYLYFSPQGMFLSPNGKQWAAVQEGSALGKLYQLKQGTFQLGFGKRKGEQASFSLRLERN